MSNIKETIRQEIERRKKICEGIFERESDTYYQGKAVAYGELLPFIDSLPEESENHGCGVEFPHFGANYPDAKCIDGYLWDMDSYEDGIYTIGGDDPCPICNTEKWLKDVLDDELFKTRDEALEYVKMLKSKYKHKDSLPEEKATCKTCGFYENNCPFIRGKLIPYPNKVCKDYTYSAMKEQEKPLGDLEGKQMIKELKERIVGLDNNGNPIAAAPPDIPMIVEKVNEIIRCLNATQRE